MERLKERIADRVRSWGIPLIGFASADRWRNGPFPDMPEEFFPDKVYPGTRTVIVIGIPVILPVLETTPSVQYHDHYNVTNQVLDEAAYRLALFLNEDGASAVAVSRDGYAGIEALRRRPFAAFSHRHAAYLAGLGSFGVNNSLLTKAYGPRVRFASVLTELDIEPDPILSEGLCIRCMRCVKACPVGAIPGDDYPQGLMDKSGCTEFSYGLSRSGTSPCGICIKVCPVGEDRKLHRREDPSIYEREGEMQRSWEHVRAYGRK